MTTYLVKYWRNDGDWHDSSYDLVPMYVFEARNDSEARKLALAYIIFSKREHEDFWISKLFELNLREVEVKDKFSRAKPSDKDKLEERLRTAGFMPLREKL